MNITHLEHALYALAMQVVIGLLTGNWWAGACLAIGFFLAREHAQVEKNIPVKERLYGFAAFDIRRWSTDAKLDFICPTVAVIALILIKDYAL